MHTKHAGQWSRDDTHAGDEAGKEDGQGAAAMQEIFTGLYVLVTDMEYVFPFTQQGPAAEVADGESDVVAQGGRSNAHQDDPRQL